MQLYLAGPMRGHPRHNFPAFDAGRDTLREAGHDVASPADMSRAQGFDPDKAHTDAELAALMPGFLAADCLAICEAQAVVFLPGWDSSAGCAVELRLAMLLKKELYLLEPGGMRPLQDSPRARLLLRHVGLTEACREIMAAKNHDYTCDGDPYANFRASAVLDVEPAIGLLLRCLDKIKRLQTFATQGELKVANESQVDAVMDVINYMVLLDGLMAT